MVMVFIVGLIAFILGFIVHHSVTRQRLRDEAEEAAEKYEESRRELERVRAKAELSLNGIKLVESKRENIEHQVFELTTERAEVAAIIEEMQDRYEVLVRERVELINSHELNIKNYAKIEKQEKEAIDRRLVDETKRVEEELERMNEEITETKQKLDSAKALYQAVLKQEKEVDREDKPRIKITKDEQAIIDLVKGELTRSLPESFRQGINKLVWEQIIRDATNDMIKSLTGGERVSGIYRITNTENNLSYIGRSVNISTRLSDHVRGAVGASSAAQQDIQREMGENLGDWTFEILEEVPREELADREKFYIDFYATNVHGYNKQRGG